MTTTEKSEYLFNKLKREGECWKHNWIGHIGRDHAKAINYTYRQCELCGLRYEEGIPLPGNLAMNFFSPSSEEHGWIMFGWLWERTPAELKESFESGKYSFLLIKCSILANALYEWFESQKGSVIDTHA